MNELLNVCSDGFCSEHRFTTELWRITNELLNVCSDGFCSEHHFTTELWQINNMCEDSVLVLGESISPN